MNKQQVD